MFDFQQMLRPVDPVITVTETAYDVWRRAEFQFAERRYYDAARNLEDLLARDDVEDSQLRQVRELLARSYFHSAQVNKAIESSTEALELDPDNGYLMLLLGRSLERAGRRREAEKYIRLADALGVN